MHEFDLRAVIPGDADFIVVYALTQPEGRSIEVRRSRKDEEPLLIPCRTRAIIGVPQGRKLFLSSTLFSDEFKLSIEGWF